MKKYIFTLAASLMLVTACDTDSLDIEQQGVIGTDTYVTADDATCLQYIAAVYSAIRGDAYNTLMGQSDCYLGVRSDLERMAGETSDPFQYSEGSDGTTYTLMYSYYYKIIYWCNMIIENLPNNNVASAETRERLIAEARGIRAIEMMQLVQLWGNPPLADHIMDGSEGNTPAEESWAWIENELKEAAETLPSKGGKGGQKAIGGRLTREAAYAYLGKAQLWQGKYSEAAQTLHDKVIATGYYDLLDDFDGINDADNDFCDEFIWEFDYNESSGYESAQNGIFDIIYYCPNVTVFYGKYFNDYGTFNYTWGNGAHPSLAAGQFFESHEFQSIDWTTFQVSYTNRMNGTLAGFYTMLSGIGYTGTPMENCSGYFKLKDQPLAKDGRGTFPYCYSVKNVVYMRYAEVLLNYAEAVCNGGSNGSTMSGLEAFNKVRTRAGLGEVASLAMDGDTGIKAERRAELFGEGQRFIDLVRWGDAATVLADCGKNNPTFSYDASYVTSISYKTTSSPGFIAGKNELFPYPSSDISASNNVLKQNPNW